jgi:hypothetical protein
MKKLRVLFVCKRGRGRPRVDGGHGGPPHYKKQGELEASGVVSIEAFRAARDELRVRVEEFIRQRMQGASAKMIFTVW